MGGVGRLLAGIAVVASSTALGAIRVSAADLPAKASPLPAAIPAGVADWSGFYLGGHVGWASPEFRGTYDDVSDNRPIDLTGSGVVYGAQAGYNLQFGRLVYGVEVDGTWGTADASRRDREGDRERMETSMLASARLRSGAVIDNIWLYGTIGIGYVRSKFTVTGSDDPSPASRDIDGYGLASGFGAELALTPNWSMRAEYLYYAINARKDLRGLTDDSDPRDFAKLDGVHVLRFAANYRFGGAALSSASVAPSMDWSGLYVGGHGGWGRSRILGVYDEAGDSGSFDIDPIGFLGGGQIGYNFQRGAWVYGIEGDGSFADMKNDRIDSERDTQKLETSSLASVRARLGFAADNRLYYITAGWGRIDSKLSVTEAGRPASRSFDSDAFVFGSGVDWAFTPNWSARLEGLTYLADNQRGTTRLTVDSDRQDFVRQGLVGVIRAGVNYRFGGL